MPATTRSGGVRGRVFVAVVLAAFLVVFGLIAIAASLQESWIGEGVRVVGRFEFLGEMRTLSAELLAVATLLGAIIGLYFTGLALTDAAYRWEYPSRVIDEVQQIASVRAVTSRRARRRGCRG